MKKILFFTWLFSFLILTALFTGCSNSVKGMIVYAGIAGDGRGSFIYAVSPDGSAKKQLTKGARADCYPAVSPDGKTIVFSALGDDYKYRIYAMDGSGKNLRKVAETKNDAILPSWSTDGSRIAFLDRTSDHTTCLYIVNPDGTKLVKIVDGAGHNDDYQYPPEWSRDGKMIIYSRKNMDKGLDVLPECIYMVNTDGSGEVPFGDQKQTRYDGNWSPDNKKVVYYSQKTEFNYNRQDNSGIFVMNSDGSAETYLAAGYRPVWSPDGSLIAYTSMSEGYDRVFLMYPDGTGPGKSEVFTNMEGEESGGDPIPLPVSIDNSPGVKDPVWSPDGKRIAFVTDTGDQAKNQLIVADISGNTPVVLSNNVLGRSRPDWK